MRLWSQLLQRVRYHLNGCLLRCGLLSLCRRHSCQGTDRILCLCLCWNREVGLQIAYLFPRRGWRWLDTAKGSFRQRRWDCSEPAGKWWRWRTRWLHRGGECWAGWGWSWKSHSFGRLLGLLLLPCFREESESRSRCRFLEIIFCWGVQVEFFCFWECCLIFFHFNFNLPLNYSFQL